MPDIQLTNPTAQENEQWGISNQVVEVQFDPAGTGVMTNGQIVQVSGGYTPGTGDVTSVGTLNTTPYPVIRLNPTTSANTILGVVVNAPKGGYLPGSIVQVCIQGIADALFDATAVTYGGFVIGSTTTAGSALYSATATLGKTLGVALFTNAGVAGLGPVLIGKV